MMKSILVMGFVFSAMHLGSTSANAFAAVGTYPSWNGTYGFCPTCTAAAYPVRNSMPWGAPSPWWWNTGPMSYSNFYSPAPWTNYGMFPGVPNNYYPGSGHVYAAKPNIYLEGAKGTEVKMKLQLKEAGANWLVAVPAHGRQGWEGTLAEKNQIKTAQGTYRYLYTDYRMHGRQFQDKAGFCATRDKVVGKIADSLHRSGFAAAEIADFIEYWSVKFPPSKRYCVFPQDEAQLNTVATFEVEPKPAAVKRLLFIVQVDEGLNASGEKFTAAPKKEWSPEPLRVPAAEKAGLLIREWGVGFLSAKP